MKRVYTCFCTDVIHEGHRNISREAVKYGELTIGVLSDAAMIRFNRFPTISFEERMQLVKDIPEVSNVVVQDDVMYDKVIEELRPDYVIHGDNWQEGPLKAIRDNVEGLLKTYGGEIIDVPYTYNEEVKRIDTRIKEKLAMPEYRRKRLRQLIEGLPARERKLILLRYGMAGQPPLTQLETAQLLQISRSYVSRLETHALEQLRKAWHS